jgi:hypothetical protein
MAVSSWDHVSRSTIWNCFRHCGFFRAKCSMEEIDDGYNEFKQIETQYKAIVKDETIDFETYVSLDDNFSVALPLNEHPTIETEDENSSLDINGDVNSFVHSNELLQLANQMQNVIFNECKSYTQVSIEKYLNKDLLNK